MPSKITTTEELIALFEKKATAPPPESSRMLARHLQCKQSLAVSRILTKAMERHAGADSDPLAVPSDLLPPLG
jgi:hypothetical protein